MEITFHLTPQRFFDAQDVHLDYRPSAFDRDGFIHCTDDPAEMARVANAYYKDDLEPHYYLYVDKVRLKAPVRYDDAAHQYPHIYGALNRDAIVAVRPARRAPDGTFLPPEPW